MKKRKIVVVILAIYLFVLAILTICSSEILKRSLPQMPVMPVQSMYLDGEYYDQVVMQKAVQYGENDGRILSIPPRLLHPDLRTLLPGDIE